MPCRAGGLALKSGQGMDGNISTAVPLPGNETGSTPRDEELAQVEVAVQAVILALAVFGNVCVLLALGRRRKVSRRMHVFIFHLSVADLLVAFFNILPQLAWDITGTFQGGDTLCRVVKYLQVFVMYLSTYILVMTAIDRYVAICHPLSTHGSRARKLPFMVLGSYALSALLSLPQPLLFSLQPTEHGTSDCWVHFDPPWMLQFYITAFTLAVYIVPLAILLFTYGSICRVIWSKHRQSQRAVTRRQTVNGVESCVTYQVHYGSTRTSALPARNAFECTSTVHPRSHSLRRFSKAKLKTVKLTFVVIIAYVVCWSPFFVCQLWWLYDESAPMSHKAVVVMLLLGSLNSCCNPWIYLAFSGDLIRQFSPCKTLSRLFRRQGNPGEDRSALTPVARRGDLILENLNAQGAKLCGGESHTSVVSWRTTRKDTNTSSPKEASGKGSHSSSTLGSPHVNKRARIHERPVTEVLEAQRKWEQSMSDVSDPDCVIANPSFLRDVTALPDVTPKAARDFAKHALRDVEGAVDCDVTIKAIVEGVANFGPDLEGNVPPSDRLHDAVRKSCSSEDAFTLSRASAETATDTRSIKLCRTAPQLNGSAFHYSEGIENPLAECSVRPLGNLDGL